MSPLWRDQLNIVLRPDRVVLVRLGRGLRPRVVDKQILVCAPAAAGEPAWAHALAALKDLLEAQKTAANARLVLSNHFVRYAVVPWSDQLSNEEEQAAFVRHRYTQVYGDAANDWEMVLSNGSAGVPRLASAIDRTLLDAARGIFAGSKIRLRSLQPYLMAAFNHWRREFDNGGAWLALAEPGRLCLALLYQGQWHSVRTRHVGPMLSAELPLILDQERLLSGLPDAPARVFLHVPEDPAFAPGPRSGWSVLPLKLEPSHGFSPSIDAPYSMAMSGGL